MADQEPIVAGLAGRYATALYELAEEDRAIDDVAADLRSLQTLMDESADLRRLVRNPLFSRDEQANAIGAVAERVGYHALTRKFLGLVAAKRRLFALPDIIRAYLTTLAQRRGEVAAQVTTAHALADSQVEALKSALRGTAGSDVQIETRIDESLLGGLVVRMGSRMIDASLRTKLANLKIAMKEVG